MSILSPSQKTRPNPPPPAEIDAAGNPIYRFPPFPTPPPGITIIPFKDFKPSGIQCPALGFPDGIERDGLGIPTCMLDKKVDDHEHVSGTGKKKKRRNKKKGGAGFGFYTKEGRRVPWWEEWAEGEEDRGVRELDLELPMRDRYAMAAGDFVSGRRMNAETQSIYDNFALFTGLLGRNLQPPLSKHAKELIRQQNATELDFDSDDDLPDMTVPPKAKAATVEDAKDNSDSGADDGDDASKNKKKSPNKASDSAAAKDQDTLPKPFSEDIDKEDQEAFQKTVEEEEDAIADRMTTFLDNPAFGMNVFLSSHFRDKGLIWSNTKLEQAPKLIEFFIQFLIRNKVLPEIKPKLMMCLPIIEQAKVELPATAIIGYAIPDPFAKACTATWGSKQGMLDPVPMDWEATLDEITGTKRKEGEEDVVEIVTEGVAEERPQINDQGGSDNPAEKSVRFQDDSGWGLNEELDEDGEPSWGVGAGWGTSADNAWAQAEEEIVADWEADGPQISFITYFGPVPVSRSFKHRYYPTVVENSLRRIGKIYEPGTVFPEDQDEDNEDNEGGKRWENEQLSVVELLPWDIPPESPLREPEICEIPPEGEEDQRKGVNEISKEKDTRKKKIRALVPPKVAKDLVGGMILGGIYVKITEVPEEGEGEPKEGEKKREWWYIEKVLQTLPSYYAELNAGFINNLLHT